MAGFAQSLSRRTAVALAATGLICTTLAGLPGTADAAVTQALHRPRRQRPSNARAPSRAWSSSRPNRSAGGSNVKRADPRQHRSPVREPRFEVERAWLWRAGAVAAIVALLVLIAKVSMIAFGGAGKRLDRYDPGHRPASIAPRDD